MKLMVFVWKFYIAANMYIVHCLWEVVATPRDNGGCVYSWLWHIFGSMPEFAPEDSWQNMDLMHAHKKKASWLSLFVPELRTSAFVATSF